MMVPADIALEPLSFPRWGGYDPRWTGLQARIPDRSPHLPALTHSLHELPAQAPQSSSVSSLPGQRGRQVCRSSYLSAEAGKVVSFHERHQYPAKSIPRRQVHWSTSDHHASLSPQCEALATFRTDASEHVASLLIAEPRRGAEITHILENVCETLCAAGMVPLTELCPPSASTPHGTCPCSLLARGEECDNWRKCTTTLTSHLHMLRWKPLFSFRLPSGLAYWQ